MIIKPTAELALNFPMDIGQYQFWNKLCALPFVKAVYLFGSRARGDARSKSDILKVKRKSAELNIPYQTILASVIHQFATGKIKVAM